MSEIFSSRFFDVFKRNNFFFWLSGGTKREKEVLKILHDFTDNVIATRREELVKIAGNGGKSIEEEDEVGSKRKLALLDILLQSTIDGKPLTNMDIREEVDTFIFEGKLRLIECNVHK